jgi:hypothetical protein
MQTSCRRKTRLAGVRGTPRKSIVDSEIRSMIQSLTYRELD